MLVALAMIGLVGLIQPHGTRCGACGTAVVSSAR